MGHFKGWRTPLTGGPADAVETPPQHPERHHDAIVDCALYIAGVRQPEQRTFAEMYDQARDTPDAFVWIGLHEPDEADFAAVASTFGLHPLAVEDALSPEQRPKIERYEDITFLAIRAASYVEHAELTETSEVIDTGSVRIFVAERFVITVRHGAIGELRSVRADLEAHRKLLAQGPWAVVHAVYDRVVDVYLTIVAAIQRDLDHVEAKVFQRTAGIDIGHVYQLKRELVEFRSAVVPLQQPLAAILEGHLVQLPKEIRRYFRDVADHHNRVVDRVNASDDLINSVLQARLTQVTVDQNNDMRKIAAWAAIAALQTAIAGIYGMNFKYMPELNWRYGYPIVLTIMLISSIILYRYLRRSGWL
ncbi:magnesium/cobalt transporter CorA [Dactylosporangium sp. NPDC049140]|uniref:magnesium/cobalt transporter CorA n=1 Tax=Dactylosporangium sp. NPDC049140 TaxID=3155647 RepID=UPI0033CF5A8A